jgi:streptomycin 6-kinase
VLDLDVRAQRAADHWNLAVGQILAGGTSSAVFAVRDEMGRDLVLKLPAARTYSQDLVAAETAALVAWAHTGAAVSLVDATADALLLARVRPGVVWPWIPGDSLVARAAVAAELLSRLWIPPPSGFQLPTLAEVYCDDERVAVEDAAIEQRERGEPDRGVPGLLRLPAAKACAQHLISASCEQKLLHGDFISKNLVSDSTSALGSVALDPLPMVGDPVAEAAAFAAYHPVELILPIAEALARLLKLDVGRTLRWAAIWTVHQAAQAWRDDQIELERLVASDVVDDLLGV